MSSVQPPQSDKCPTCGGACDSEYIEELGDCWTDALVFYCENHDTYPVQYYDSDRLARAIEDRIYAAEYDY
jgi:hypothetical protein